MNNNWKISDITIAVILEIVLTIGAVLTFVSMFPHNVYVSLSSTVIIHLIVISYLNSKYPINLFNDAGYTVILTYMFIGVLLCSINNLKYYYWLLNNNYALPE